MAPDQIEQEIDELTKRVEALDAKLDLVLARIEGSAQFARNIAFGGLSPRANYGVAGNSCQKCGQWIRDLPFGATCDPCQRSDHHRH